MLAIEQILESTPTLYERIGGEGAINAAVDIFYNKVLSDSLLKPFFADTDMPSQMKKQKQFLIYAFGGPNHYTGLGLRNAHKAAVAKGMNDTHFDQVMKLLGDTLTELQVPLTLIKEAAAIAESTRKDVLNKQ
jgi:hemoglobin